MDTSFSSAFSVPKGTREKIHRAQERLVRMRTRYSKRIPRWYINKLLRNLGKFLEVLKRYYKATM